MKKFKRPKPVRLSLEKRVLVIQQLLNAAHKQRDYIAAHVDELIKNQLIQDGALSLIYDTLIEMGTPRYVRLWRWVKGKIR